MKLISKNKLENYVPSKENFHPILYGFYYLCYFFSFINAFSTSIIAYLNAFIMCKPFDKSSDNEELLNDNKEKEKINSQLLSFSLLVLLFAVFFTIPIWPSLIFK